MTRNLTKRFKNVRIIAYESFLGECANFLSMIFVSHYMFIIFLSVLISHDISLPTVLSDNTPFVESIFSPIFYLPGAKISDFLLICRITRNPLQQFSLKFQNMHARTYTKTLYTGCIQENSNFGDMEGQYLL